MSKQPASIRAHLVLTLVFVLWYWRSAAESLDSLEASTNSVSKLRSPEDGWLDLSDFLLSSVLFEVVPYVFGGVGYRSSPWFSATLGDRYLRLDYDKDPFLMKGSVQASSSDGDSISEQRN